MKKFHKKPSGFVKQVCLRVTDIERSHSILSRYRWFRMPITKGQGSDFNCRWKDAFSYFGRAGQSMPKEKRTTGLYHFALLLRVGPISGSFLKHFIGKGISIRCADHQVSEANYIDDPDGNRIEITGTGLLMSGSGQIRK